MAKISNNQAWDNIFEDLNIIDTVIKKGYFDISADEIKSRDGKEARLMTKIDHKEHLPAVMKKNKLSILAIKNGLYRIASNSPFIDIEEEIKCQIQVIEQPRDIITINPLDIKSESAALDVAKISGMLDIVFNEKTDLTIRGRLRGDLSFSIGSIDYHIQGVQIEVDGGYEGSNTVNLIESKIGFRGNMNIRQLLYPELVWKKNVKNKKQVNSYIFYYHNSIFRFIPFKYVNNKFLAMHKDEKAFRFRNYKSFSLNDIKKANDRLVDTSVPFPEANSFDRIHAIILNTTREECPTKMSIIIDFDISLNPRQYDYYFNVLKWMKLCEYRTECISITEKGNYLLSLNDYDRMIEFAIIVFSEPICFNLLHDLPIDTNDINEYPQMGDSTIKRRVNTIESWIKYFNDFFNRGLFDE